VAGTAEATSLPSDGVDLVTAGQAFHWFDAARARREFARILRAPGFVALFWNSRHSDTTPFLRAYEDLLHAYGTDYGRINHRNIDPAQLRRFLPGSYQYFSFPNEQIFDFAGLEGRLLSSSYAPGPHHLRHEPMMKQLSRIFEEHQEGGNVRFLYTTELHVGRLR
jgi:SAM-dependent methyltransferase